MSGVKTWNLFYSDYRRAELCICEQRVIFLKKKKERKKEGKKEKERKKRGFENRDAHSLTHTHTHIHTHKTFVLFLKLRASQDSE